MVEERRGEAPNYKALRPHVRDFLERLDEDDVRILALVIKSYEKASTIGAFFKWLGLAMLAVFGTIVTLGEQIRKAYGWFFS